MEETHNSVPQKSANHAASTDHASRILSDNYVIIGPLVETELSSIAIIRELSSGRHLLAKTISSENETIQERFHAAILEHGKLQHTNVAQTVDWRLSDDGKPVFISEFLEGINLQDLIDEVGTLEDDDEITTFLFQICESLEYAHGLGVVHGGLKPSNIVIVKPEDVIIVKLLDFGQTNLSRELPEHPEIADSPYLSPEQKNGAATFKSDVFSLAAVAYQLITGYLPFIKIDDGRVVDETSELAPIFEYRPDIPEANLLGDVLAKALEWDPKKRTATVREFRAGVLDWYHAIGGIDNEPDDEEEEELVPVSVTIPLPAAVNQDTVPDEEWISADSDSAEPSSIELPTSNIEVDDAEFGFDESVLTQNETADVKPNETSESRVEETDLVAIANETAEARPSHSPAVADEILEEEPVSDIGIIVRSQEPLKRKPGDPGYNPDDDLDELDDLDDLDDLEGSVSEDVPITAQSSTSSTTLKPISATGFGAEIADDEFGFDDSEGTETAFNEIGFDQTESVETGNTPTFTPGENVDPTHKLERIDAAAAESTIPPDQEHSGRFSRVARLPAMQPIDGMKPTIAPVPVPIKTEAELEHEKERETIKKFKKPPKRKVSKLDSTMTKLMALRSTQVEQELTVSTKFSETFAKDGPRQSPKMVIARIVASIVIFLASSVLLFSNMSVLSSVWTVASRNLSAMILKKPTVEDDTAIGATQTIIKEVDGSKTKVNPTTQTATATAAATPDANPIVIPASKRRETNIIYVPRIIDRRNIAPSTLPAPGTRSYSGVVYPYLYTEEAAQRDPKKPRPSDSPVKDITGR